MSLPNSADVAPLAHALARTLPDFSRDTALSLALLRLLAQGQPVSMSSLAAGLHRTVEEVSQGVERLTNVERDASGRIVAAVGLSLRPTPHCFTLPRHTLYTWCALDALMYPAQLNEPASISSRCPITGTTIQLTVAPNGICRVAPPGAVVSLVIPDAEAACCDVRGAFCNAVHFVASAEAAATWAAQQPARQPVRILSVAEAFAVGAAITQLLYGATLRRMNG